MDCPEANFLSVAAKKKKGKNKVEEGTDQMMKTADKNQLGSCGRDPKGSSCRNVAAVGQECQERILVPGSSLWLLLNEYFFLEAICKSRTEP